MDQIVCKQSGKTVTGLITGVCGLVAINMLILSIMIPALAHTREKARRTICKVNLSGLGKGFVMYASMHEDLFPFAGDKPTVAENMWLLMEEEYAIDKMFVCPSVKGDPDVGQPLTESDKTHFSYSYQAAMFDGLHYSNGVTDKSQDRLPIMTDKTPGKASEFDWSRGSSSAAISRNHRGYVINILHKDSSVSEAKRADVGIAGDNVYTVGPGPLGRYVADGTTGHTNPNDSVLVGP